MPRILPTPSRSVSLDVIAKGVVMLNELSQYLSTNAGSERGRTWGPPRNTCSVKILQTPNIWGKTMDRGAMVGTGASMQELKDSIVRVMSGTSALLDITSLDPPRGRTPDGIFLDALRDGLTAISRSKGKKTVRFLFGWPFDRLHLGPVGYSSGNGPGSHRKQHHQRFKAWLATFIPTLGPNAPDVYYGIYSNGAGSVFNHAKIVCNDNGGAVVGGHNMYDADYNQYPPVHDLSVEVWGRVAFDVQNFAKYLWDYGGMTSVDVGRGRQGQSRSEESWSTFFRNQAKQTVSTTWLEGWHLNGNSWEALSYNALRGVADKGTYVNPDDVGRNPTANLRGFHDANVMCVGRMGGACGSASKQNTSHLMKDFLIQNARGSIHMSHQDLSAMDLAGGYSTTMAHWTCEALATALRSNANLRVYVFVTGPYGSGKMDAYTNNANGPQNAADYIMYYTRNSAWNRASRDVWNRLRVAPFRFTNDYVDGEPYWHDAANEKEDCEGALTEQGVLKAVGNHSKLTLVDDQTFVVGSDNHYPHALAEINLVMEGDIVGVLRRAYWEPLMKYSLPHAVSQWQTSRVWSSL
jgi:murine toxin